MAIKVVVFGGQNRLFQMIRKFLNTRDAAPFLAEFANQHAIGSKYPQRQLGSVVGERVNRGQTWPGYGQGKAQAQGGEHNTCQSQSEQIKNPAGITWP